MVVAALRPWCGVINGGPPVAFVYLNRERGVFYGKEELAKVVASPLPW